MHGDLVAWADTECGQGEVQGRRARPDAHRMSYTTELGEVPLELRDLPTLDEPRVLDDVAHRGVDAVHVAVVCGLEVYQGNMSSGGPVGSSRGVTLAWYPLNAPTPWTKLLDGANGTIAELVTNTAAGRYSRE